MKGSPSRGRRQAIFLGAAEPHAARPESIPAARMLAPLVGQGRLTVVNAPRVPPPPPASPLRRPGFILSQ